MRLTLETPGSDDQFKREQKWSSGRDSRVRFTKKLWHHQDFFLTSFWLQFGNFHLFFFLTPSLKQQELHSLHFFFSIKPLRILLCGEHPPLVRFSSHGVAPDLEFPRCFLLCTHQVQIQVPLCGRCLLVIQFWSLDATSSLYPCFWKSSWAHLFGKNQLCLDFHLPACSAISLHAHLPPIFTCSGLKPLTLHAPIFPRLMESFAWPSEPENPIAYLLAISPFSNDHSQHKPAIIKVILTY